MKVTSLGSINIEFLLLFAFHILIADTDVYGSSLAAVYMCFFNYQFGTSHWYTSLQSVVQYRYYSLMVQVTSHKDNVACTLFSFQFEP